jgi:hypothetical protein
LASGVAKTVIYRKRTYWPVMLILGIGALCSFAQDASRYFFQPRISAQVDYCSARLCTVVYPGHTAVPIDDGAAAGLSTGQTVRTYATDDHHVRLDSAAPPWTVWLFAVLALAYLIAVAVRVTQATATRRAALARGEKAPLLGEAGVLAWWLGPPLIVVGGLLALGEHSRTAGWLTIAAGFVVTVGFSALWIAVNRGRGATPAA